MEENFDPREYLCIHFSRFRCTREEKYTPVNGVCYCYEPVIEPAVLESIKALNQVNIEAEVLISFRKSKKRDKGN